VVSNVDRELLEYFLRARPNEVGGDHASPVMTRIVERLLDSPAMVFSRSGEVLLQTRPAIALFGDCTRFGGSSRHLVDRWLADPVACERHLVEVGVTGHWHLRRYRHADLGELELYRLLLVDPVEHQMLLVFMAVPGSPTDEELRRLTLAVD
jgi:hypothetical protein